MDISRSEPTRRAVTRREFTLIIASSFG
ncbi:MAG: hypothetical protein QOG58_6296, partial [Caballeronia sp.]|nr:hypothetical protein [Caballeronia sp.]